MSGILRLESLTKGNTLKQGDKTPLKYRLFDADGEKLNIAGKSAQVRLVYPDFLTIGYEKDGLTVAQDDTVTFAIDQAIPARIYHVEIIVDGQFIFPSRADEAKFTIDKSSLNIETNIIEIVGVDQIVNKVLDKVENGAVNAEPKDGSVTTDKLAGKAVDLSKLNIIGYLPKSIEYNFEDATNIRGLSQEIYLNVGDTITTLGKYSYVLYRIPSSGSTYSQAEWQSSGGWRTTDITIDTAGLYLIRTNPVAGGTLTDNDLVEMTNTIYIITSDTAVKRKELDDRLANFEGGGSGGVDESQVLQILSDSELVNNLRTDIATLTNGLGVERVSSPLNLPFEILKIAGQYTTNLDVESLKKPVSKRYYVDNVNGKYNNPGTQESPLDSIWRAYGKSDCDEIVLLNNSYGWTTGMNGYPITRPVNIIAEGHAVLGSFRENVIYTQDTTYQNVYVASERNIHRVADLTDMDRPLNYEQVNSLEECASKRYSWFRPNNDQVYVNTGNGIPDDNIFLMLSSNAISVDDSDFYAENITFLNTVRSQSTIAPKKRIVLNNCDIYLGITNNALTVLGSDAISINTSTQYADMDGFNYHINGDLLPTAIEINCSGRYNGLDGAGQNNGSTMHDGGTVVRIGGTYEQNNGPNVIDVNEGGKSLNVGVKSFRSKGISGTVSHADFRNGNIGMSDMWLIDCVSYGSEYSVVTRGGGRTIIEGGMIMGLIEEQ